MESELSLANCIPLHISHDADACFRIVGCTCLGGTFLAGAPPPRPFSPLLMCHLPYSPVSHIHAILARLTWGEPFTFL